MGGSFLAANAQASGTPTRPLTTTTASSNSSATKSRFPIANLQAPGNREGGASRGSCLTGSQRLTALMPENSSGRTIAAHPTLYVYIPNGGEQQAELLLRDLASGKSLYRQPVTINQTPGVVAVAFPADQPPLEIDRLYQWQFRLICDPDDRERDLTVAGVVQRVQPSPALSQQLATAQPARKAALFEEAGLWYEALQSTAELRQSDPNLATNQWEALLQEVGLAPITQQPIVSCCRQP